MDRIVVIGSPGAGKTTFARRLGDLLRIKPIHLDRHFWDADWKEKPREVRESIQRDLVHSDKWIIEGTYLDSSDERLRAADSIIFLDIPRLLCLWRVLKRRVADHNKLRPDLPVGCTERLRLPYILKVLVFPQKGHRLFLKKIRKIDEMNMDFFWLKSNKDIEAFLGEYAVPLLYNQQLSENQREVTILSKLTATAVFILDKLWEGLGKVGTSLNFACLPPIACWDTSDNGGWDTMH